MLVMCAIQVVQKRRTEMQCSYVERMKRLLSSVLLHGQDLDHANEDVDEVKFKADGLVDGITLNQAALAETGVVQDLLDVVEGEATKDDKTTVEPEVLSEHES